MTRLSAQRLTIGSFVLLALLAFLDAPAYAQNGAKYTQTLTFSDSATGNIAVRVIGPKTANTQTVVSLEFGSDDPNTALPANAFNNVAFALTLQGGPTLNFNIGQTSLTDSTTFAQKIVLFTKPDAASSPLLYALVIVHSGTGIAPGSTENWTLAVSGLPPTGSTPHSRVIAFIDQGKAQTLLPIGMCGGSGPSCPAGQSCQSPCQPCPLCPFRPPLRFYEKLVLIPWPFPPPPEPNCPICGQLEIPIPSGFERKIVSLTPYTREGVPLGPGRSGEVTLNIKGGDAVGKLVDMGSGEYLQLVQYPTGSPARVSATAAGVMSEEIVTGSQDVAPIYRTLTYVFGVIALLVLGVAGFRGRAGLNKG